MAQLGSRTMLLVLHQSGANNRDVDRVTPSNRRAVPWYQEECYSPAAPKAANGGG